MKKDLQGKSPRYWSKALIKELLKHAQRDDCFDCKYILRAMGVNPESKEKEAAA